MALFDRIDQASFPAGSLKVTSFVTIAAIEWRL
jgi:hypothetical protein